MANFTRTIYTQGNLQIQPVSPGVNYGASFTGAQITGTNGVFISGVQSANFTANSPKIDVNSFGVFGPVDKVQVESSTATLEVSMVLHNHSSSGWLSTLIADSQLPNPSGWNVTVSGVGAVKSGVLTAFRMEAAIGALPTINLTFDGVSGAYPTPGTAPNVYTPITIGVITPDQITGLWWSGNSAEGVTGCPQSVRVNWEMPVERLNCLGNPINQPTIFTRPPGTLSFVVEGIDYALLGNVLTGVQIGNYGILQGNVRATNQTANMAVGDAAATFNQTSESVALGATVISL